MVPATLATGVFLIKLQKHKEERHHIILSCCNPCHERLFVASHWYASVHESWFGRLTTNGVGPVCRLVFPTSFGIGHFKFSLRSVINFVCACHSWRGTSPRSWNKVTFISHAIIPDLETSLPEFMLCTYCLEYIAAFFGPRVSCWLTGLRTCNSLFDVWALSGVFQRTNRNTYLSPT